MCRCVENHVVCREAVQAATVHSKDAAVGGGLSALMTWPLSPTSRGNRSIAVWPSKMACCVAGLGAFPEGCSVSI